MRDPEKCSANVLVEFDVLWKSQGREIMRSFLSLRTEKPSLVTEVDDTRVFGVETEGGVFALVCIDDSKFAGLGGLFLFDERESRRDKAITH